ncbi:hypothetical protein [Engelhardtia mirabilis]|uniref:NHL repeat protein n=1 Tax=Engelhardtia mirabilis TaxID=2528011 RepID=A0A518BQS8_9BACT|nr:NHL repeat protein [Planctomycetes bacterium Pla133]QDV03663.1 NHL repeat protein [Planctomycetes bacterium Pla86]
MTPLQLLCVPLLLAAAHDPHDGAGHHHHPADGQEPRFAPAVYSDEPVYVGEGAHRYRWESRWLQLPEGREWLGSTHGCIVVDRAGRVYLSAEEGAAVLVFDADGALVDSFGEEWGAGLHGLSIGVDWVPDREMIVSKEGRVRGEVLWLAHTARQEVIKTTLGGEVLMTIPPPPAEAGLYPDPGSYKPTSVAVAPDGTIFVADGYGLSWIHRYDAEGNYLDSFGGRGKRPEQLGTPHGLWIETRDGRTTLLVADRGHSRIARFSTTGEYIGCTDPDSGLLRRPCHLQFEGDVGVVADLAGRVTLLDRDLNLICHLGDNPVESERAQFDVTPDHWREGAFIAPHCARIASGGEIYVMDWNVAGRLTRLVPDPAD